jgi:hypothetical protein
VRELQLDEIRVPALLQVDAMLRNPCPVISSLRGITISDESTRDWTGVKLNQI